MRLICNSCDGAYSSLDVRFTKACDNNCPFCIEKTGIDSKPFLFNKMVKSTINSGIKDVLILGGEPFLLPSLLKCYVSGIRNHVDRIYITTSLPESFIKDRQKCDEIINIIDGLNVSIQHNDWRLNNLILNASKDHNRIDILKSLNEKYSDKIRTSINLVAGCIDSKVALIDCLRSLESIGCKNIKINELQNSKNLYVSYEKIMNVKLKSPFSHGCQTPVRIDGIKMNLMLKRSCFVTESSLKASYSDLLKSFFRIFIKNKTKFRVLYENGQIENGWLKKQE